MSERFFSAFSGLVERVMSRVDYFALYPARVVQQDPQGRLELQPDDARLPGFSAVPIRLGLPGASVIVQAGARVLLGWEGGDRQRPYASLWESASVTELRLGAESLKLNATTLTLNDGTAPVARVGDSTSGHTHTVVFALTSPSGNVTGTIELQSATDEIAEGAEGVLA